MDTRLGILISENYDSANAAWDAHERKILEGYRKLSGAQGTASDRVVGAQKKAYDSLSYLDNQHRTSALANIKTVEEYRQDWAGKSTKKLVEYEKQLSDERINLQNKIKRYQEEGNGIAVRLHKQRLDEISAEGRALKQVSIERKEVLERGMGAIIGQLGTGRGLISSLIPLGLSSLGDRPNFLGSLGGGGSALGGGFDSRGVAEASSSLAKFSNLATSALAAGGGLYGLAHFGTEFYKSGMDSAKVLQSMRLAFEAAGLSGIGLNRQMERANKLAEELSARWNVSSDRVRGLSAYIAQLGNITGEQNEHVTKMAIAVEELTSQFTQGSLTAEQFAKILARDPEAETYVGRLTLAFPVLAQKLKEAKNNAEELTIAAQFLAPKMMELDARAKSNTEATKRAAIAWEEVKREIGLTMVSGISPALGLLSKLAGFVGDNARLFGALTVVIGGTTAATALYVVAKKLLNDEEVRSVLQIPLASAAMGAEAVAADGAAVSTGAFSVALHAAMGPIGWIAGALTLIVSAVALYSAGRTKEAEADAKATDVMHKHNEEQAKSIALKAGLAKGTDEYARAVDNLTYRFDSGTTQTHRFSAANLTLKQKLEELFPDLRNNEQRIRDYGKASDKAAESLKLQNQELEKNTRDLADNAIAYVQFLQGRLSDPSVTGEKREIFEKSLNAWTAYETRLGGIISNIQKAHEKAAKPFNDATTVPTSKGHDKEIKAEDATRKEIEDREAALIKDKEQREVAQEQLRYERERKRIDTDVKNKKEHNELIELLEHEHQDKLSAIHQEASDARDKIEDKAWGKYIERLSRQAAEEQRVTVRSAETRKKLQDKLQDQSNESIEDKFKREAAIANTSYEREQRRILDQADGTKETHDLINSELEELDRNHQATLDKISGDTEAQRTKNLAAAWKDLNGELSKANGNFTDILAVLGREALSAGITRIIEALTGVDKAKAKQNITEIPTAIKEVGMMQFSGVVNMAIGGGNVAPGTPKITDMVPFSDAMGLTPNTSLGSTGGGNYLDYFLYGKKQPSLSGIPGYETGTTGTSGAKGGLSKVGERGVELLITPDGEQSLVGLDGPELRVLPKGSTVVPHSGISSWILDSLKKKLIKFDSIKTVSESTGFNHPANAVRHKQEYAAKKEEERKEAILEKASKLTGQPRIPSWIPFAGALSDYGLAHQAKGGFEGEFTDEEREQASDMQAEAGRDLAISAATLPLAGMVPGAHATSHAFGHVAAGWFENEIASSTAKVAAEQLVHNAAHKMVETVASSAIPAYADGTPDWSLSPLLSMAGGPIAGLAGGFAENLIKGLTSTRPADNDPSHTDASHFRQRHKSFGEAFNGALFATLPGALSSAGGSVLTRAMGAINPTATHSAQHLAPMLASKGSDNTGVLTDILSAIKGMPQDVLTLGPGFETTRNQSLQLETNRAQ